MMRIYIYVYRKGETERERERSLRGFLYLLATNVNHVIRLGCRRVASTISTVVLQFKDCHWKGIPTVKDINRYWISTVKGMVFLLHHILSFAIHSPAWSVGHHLWASNRCRWKAKWNNSCSAANESSVSGHETNHQNGGMTIWALHITAIALYVWGAVWKHLKTGFSGLDPA